MPEGSQQRSAGSSAQRLGDPQPCPGSTGLSPPSSPGSTSPQSPAPDGPSQALPNRSSPPRHFTFTLGAGKQAARSMQCYPTPPSAGRVPHSQPRTEAAPGPPRAPRATQPAALPPRPATAAPPDRSPGLPPLPSAMLGPAPRLSREPPPAPPSRAERGVLARAALHLPLRPPPALGGSPRRFIAAAPPSGRERAEPRPRPARHGSDVALESGFHIHILTQYYSIVFNHVISSSLHHLAASEKLPCLLPRSIS